MTDVIKAFCLFGLGCIALMHLGDAMQKQTANAEPRGGEMSSRLSAAFGASASMPAEKEEDDEVEERAEDERDPIPFADVRHPTAPPTGDYAATCARFDPIEHPEQIADILDYASSATDTPADILYAIWQKETKHVDGAGSASGTCPIMNELAIRDRAAGTAHYAAMLAMGKQFGWTDQYGENLERMTCSCPAHRDVVDEDTGETKRVRYGYGGCCGPFQFSGEEVKDKALKYGLDPMTFCGGAVIAGMELKAHHDRFVQKGVADGYPAWRRAIKRYYGVDPDNRYYGGALKYWREFHAWYAEDQEHPGFLRRKLASMPSTRYSVMKQRQLRQKSSVFASN